MPVANTVVPKPGREAAPSLVRESPADRLLPRLDALRQTGPDRWIARCPAHADRHPSLSVRELPDGVLLIKCGPGCSAAEIVSAVGLELRDLFPPTDRHHRAPQKRPWNPMDVLRCLASEARIAALAAGDLARGEILSAEDTERLALAAERLRVALRTVEGAK